MAQGTRGCEVTLDEKIAVMQAANRGESLQVKNASRFGAVEKDGWKSLPNWTTFPCNEFHHFNFAIYDYRVTPKHYASIFSRKGTKYEVIANEDGSIKFGCETIDSEVVESIIAIRKNAQLFK